jgi:LPS sulfotransferase NodH
MSGRGVTPQKGYVICGQARSGSTYLCHLLRSTGVLGLPYEIFPDAKLVRRLQSHPDQFDALITSVTTDNGIYGVKIFATQFEFAQRIRWADRLPKLHFVYLERDDLLGQALSLSRAVQTQQFKVDDPSRASPRYDRRLIADCIGRITYGAARWQGFFARNGIIPLRLTYEGLVRDPQAAITALAEHIGLTPAPVVDEQEVDVLIQRDEMSEQWRQRFNTECGDLSYFDGGMLFSGRRGGGLASRLFLGPRARHRSRLKLRTLADPVDFV